MEQTSQGRRIIGPRSISHLIALPGDRGLLPRDMFFCLQPFIRWWRRPVQQTPAFGSPDSTIYPAFIPGQGH